MGDASLGNSFAWPLATVSLKFPEPSGSDVAAAKKSSSAYKQKPNVYTPKPEIKVSKHRYFRSVMLRQRASALVSGGSQSMIPSPPKHWQINCNTILLSVVVIASRARWKIRWIVSDSIRKLFVQTRNSIVFLFIFQHMFRQPEKRPPVFVSNLFTALCLAPILILLALWAKLGVNISKFPFSLSAVVFHLGLASEYSKCFQFVFFI